MITIGELDVVGGCTSSPSPGETFTLTYSAQGVAFGPYTGTFTESGTVTIALTEDVSSVYGLALGNVAKGVVTSWVVNFTIDSDRGQVTGTKTLSTAIAYGNCYRVEDLFGFGFLDAQTAIATLEYQARIQTADGTFTDQGDAEGRLSSQCAGGARPSCDAQEVESFRELFLLSRGVLPLDTTGKATVADRSATLRRSHESFSPSRSSSPNWGACKGVVL
jgi:hypothetical protein